MNLLNEYPFFWALVWAVAGMLAMALIGWRMFPFQKTALQSLIETQKSHLVETELRYSEMKSERDKYREDLHIERNARGKDQKLIAELEARPDYGTLKTLLENQTNVMRSIGESLEGHIASDAVTFGKIAESIAQIPAVLRAIIDGQKKSVSRRRTRQT